MHLVGLSLSLSLSSPYVHDARSQEPKIYRCSLHVQSLHAVLLPNTRQHANCPVQSSPAVLTQSVAASPLDPQANGSRPNALQRNNITSHYVRAQTLQKEISVEWQRVCSVCVWRCSWHEQAALPCMDTQFLSHVATRVFERKRAAYSCCIRRSGNCFYFRGLRLLSQRLLFVVQTVLYYCLTAIR